MLDFLGEKNGDFSCLKNSNINMGEGGHKSMVFSKYFSQQLA